MSRDARLSSRARLLAAVAAVSAVAVVLGYLSFAGPTDPIDSALAELEDSAEFEKASDAGAAFVRASEHLQQAGERCGDAPSCHEWFTIAAISRVSAVAVLRCTLRDIFEVRVALRDHIEAIRAGASPPPPAPPSCT